MPRHSQDNLSQKVLEDKLKTHIQREFSLGEKVISLLKQKNELEKRLQEQQQAQRRLEDELQALGHSKKHVEEQYRDAKKVLEDRQSRLRSRSRIIVEDEGQSRENLEQLRRTIQALQQELKTVDARKGEEKTALVQRLRNLRQREKRQQEELRKIVQQRDMVGRRLYSVVKKYKQLSTAYHKEKKLHEDYLELVHKDQINREAQIELLRDETRLNEERLLKEVETLKQANTELEAKVSQLEQESPNRAWALDDDFLHVIEKQNQYIEELKDKAHQRSTLLRTENENLRGEIETMSTSQQKAKWENQMLESSLKDLQTDLAEYIQLKHKVEDVQKEREDFEMLFQRRLRFFKNRHSETVGERKQPAAEPQAPQQELAAKVMEQKLEHGRRTPTPFFQRIVPMMKSRIPGRLNILKPRLLLVFFVLIIILLTVQVFRMIPWRYFYLVTLTERLEPGDLGTSPEFVVDGRGYRERLSPFTAFHPAGLSASAQSS
ncbi:hypothetical protein CSB45_11935 [candidate division KSB3 bacterium]|uniref:Uncharacterized protein n=1 Tax=candidate division KSB3 bacterium TaxID=2044937 RepID=A0A2G6E2T3_9BACT|nr:MAG: hypothetical protein CSB45_11935 [candidate division KSB3 bacterium]